MIVRAFYFKLKNSLFSEIVLYLYRYYSCACVVVLQLPFMIQRNYNIIIDVVLFDTVYTCALTLIINYSTVSYCTVQNQVQSSDVTQLESLKSAFLFSIKKIVKRSV